MTTRLSVRREYAHSVTAFAAALVDPAFHRARLADTAGGRAEVVTHRHEAEAGTVRVTVRQPVPAGGVPVAIRRLVTGALVLERTERWQLGAERCDGRAEVVVPRAPVDAEGTMEVCGVGRGEERCRLTVDIVASVSVPLVGGGIERSVADGIRVLTAREHDRISSWLAARHP